MFLLLLSQEIELVLHSKHFMLSVMGSIFALEYLVTLQNLERDFTTEISKLNPSVDIFSKSKKLYIFVFANNCLCEVLKRHFDCLVLH